VSDFDLLFSSVWVCETPPQVLADFIRESLSESPARCILATHLLRGCEVHLSAERFYGSGGVVHVVLYCPKQYSRCTRNFTLETLTSEEFVTWLSEEMSRLSWESLKPYWREDAIR
jgi:hypothetical protein